MLVFRLSDNSNSGDKTVTVLVAEASGRYLEGDRIDKFIYSTYNPAGGYIVHAGGAEHIYTTLDNLPLSVSDVCAVPAFLLLLCVRVINFAYQVCISVCMSACMCMSVCMSVSLSVCVCACLSLSVSVCLPISPDPFVTLSFPSHLVTYRYHLSLTRNHLSLITYHLLATL